MIIDDESRRYARIKRRLKRVASSYSFQHPEHGLLIVTFGYNQTARLDDVGRNWHVVYDDLKPFHQRPGLAMAKVIVAWYLDKAFPESETEKIPGKSGSKRQP